MYLPLISSALTMGCFSSALLLIALNKAGKKHKDKIFIALVCLYSNWKRSFFKNPFFSEEEFCIWKLRVFIWNNCKSWFSMRILLYVLLFKVIGIYLCLIVMQYLEMQNCLWNLIFCRIAYKVFKSIDFFI